MSVEDKQKDKQINFNIYNLTTWWTNYQVHRVY